MKLLVTGATGFLGRHVVEEALRRGHQVRALARPASGVDRFDWSMNDNVQVVHADLRSPRGLEAVVCGVDAVIHLAADKGGDLYSQLGGTVVATENLIAAMRTEDIDRMVLTSSFSVYDYRSIRTNSVLTEESALEAHPEDRDAYCQTKLLQERLVTSDEKLRWTVLRPGVIFGPDNTWTARLGIQLGETKWLRTGGGARLPLTYVENCAEAIVIASETDAAIGQILNVVDEETPKQRVYARELARRMNPRPRVYPMPFVISRFLAWSAGITNRFVFNSNARVPQIFRTPSLLARCKPLRYDPSKIRETLNWAPKYSLQQALDRSLMPPSGAARSDTSKTCNNASAEPS